MSQPNPQPLDPTDDNLYKNLSLTDFIRSFVPQEQELRNEIQKINESKELPYLDASLPQEPVATSRNEKRKLKLEKMKAEKKKAKLVDKVKVLMNNPTALKKAIDENPKIKDIALKIRDR